MEMASKVTSLQWLIWKYNSRNNRALSHWAASGRMETDPPAAGWHRTRGKGYLERAQRVSNGCILVSYTLPLVS